MKNRRFWPDYCCFLSLVISVTMIILWICGVWELKVVNLNTFVGVIVSLLAIIVTLAIAWQIYNAVELKNKVEDLKQLEDRIIEQEKSIEEQKKSLEQSNLEKTRDLYIIMTEVRREKEKYDIAFNCSLAALGADILLEKPQYFDDILDVMDSISKALDSMNKALGITKKKTTKYDLIIEKNNELRLLSNYHYIKRRYEPIYDEFISKVEKNEN